MRAIQSASGSAIPSTPVAQCAPKILFKIKGCFQTNPLFKRSFEKAIRFGKWTITGKPLNHRSNHTHCLSARSSDRDAEFGHLAFNRFQPLIIAVSVAQQTIARTHRLFIIKHALAVTGIDCQHHAIEKPSPIRCAAGKQPVHRRNNPENARIIKEFIARCGNTIDTDLAATFAATCSTCADFDIAINHTIE